MSRKFTSAALLAALTSLSCPIRVCASDGDAAASRYSRDRWADDRGLPNAAVYAIGQTPDGYLWIGTQNALVRFDGLNFKTVAPPSNQSPALGQVLGLMLDPGGALWVRQRGRTLLRYSNGTLEDVLWALRPREFAITAMCLGNDGAPLFAGLKNGIVRYRGGHFETVVPINTLPPTPVTAMVETTDGRIWLGTSDEGLLLAEKGQVAAVAGAVRSRKINAMVRGADNALWIGTDQGVMRGEGAAATSAGVPRQLQKVNVYALLLDHASNLWVGTSSGLVVAGADGEILLDERGPPTHGALTTLFEDREGNIWAGRDHGIERFREKAFRSFGPELPSEQIGPILPDSDGRLWFAPMHGGLAWLKDTKIGRATAVGMGNDVVYSIAGGDGELWIGRQQGGLTRLSTRNGSFAAQTYTQADGLAQNSVYTVLRARDGSIWAGTLSGGISKFDHGVFTTYTTRDGLASNSVAAILEASDGAMWFATPAGLSKLSHGRWTTLTNRDGLPSIGNICLLEDPNGVIWVGTTSGLAFVQGGRVHSVAGGPDSLHELTVGLARDPSGNLWIATSNHVARLKSGRILQGLIAEGDVREYQTSDGLLSVEGVRRQKSVAIDGAGRIWFALNRGLSVIDPVHLAHADVPAIVHILDLSADGAGVPIERGPARVAAGRRRVIFSFNGISLAYPERVRYRYRLDGYDRDWSPPTARREAEYTNLGPRSYTFRVIATNSEGSWNSAETRSTFDIEPFLWQTWEFLLAVVLLAAGAIVTCARLRLRRMTTQMNMRIEERLAERTRIARELHDTLLQGFQGLMLRLQAVDVLLPARPDNAKDELNKALERADQAIAEARDSVHDLRSSRETANDLVEAVRALVNELAPAPGGPKSTHFRVQIVGNSRGLHPILCDEIYKFAREAVRNAFGHAQARRIEVEISYGDEALRVRIRDDGRGIDSATLETGREGHYGLQGMRERAARIGGQLNFWTAPGEGTEVELSIPASVAYGASAARRKFRPFAKRVG